MTNPAPLARLRVAVVGAGYVSRHHVAALRGLPFVEIVGIVDRNLEAARQVAAEFGLPAAVATLAELAGRGPNCAWILTPPSTHAPLTLEALDLGCHVYVEKPMAESLAECTQMIERARERGLVLSVNHSDLFDPVVTRAIRDVRAGACGDVQVVDVLRSSEYPPYAGGPLPGSVRKGSYPFQDLGVHALYQIEALLGPIRDLDVRYRATGQQPNLKFDEWIVTADCERGVGRVQLSWNVRPMQNRLIVQGTRGVIEIDKFLQTYSLARTLPGPKFVGMVLTGVTSSLRRALDVTLNVVRFATGRLRGSPGIRAGTVAFATALHDGTPVPVPAEDGARIVGLMEAASLRADREWSEELAARLAPLPPADCLLTGASGFLGRAVLKRLLDRGLTVRALVRRPSLAPRDPRVQTVIGDLGNPEIVEHAVAGVRDVYHVGAAMRGGPLDFQSATVWGTRNVAEACLRHGIRRLVHVSSMGVLDHANRDDRSPPVVEDSPLEPYPERRGAYTQTKMQAERIVRDLVSERGLPAVVLRPGLIFGPGAEATVPNGAIGLAGRWIFVGDGRRELPLVYVDDVVDAVLAAADPAVPVGTVVNVVDTTRVTQREYVELARRRAGAPKVVYLPRPVALGLAWAIELLGRALKRELPLSRYKIRALRPLWPLDPSRARQVLRWTPAVGTAEGLRRTFGAAPEPAPGTAPDAAR